MIVEGGDETPPGMRTGGWASHQAKGERTSGGTRGGGGRGGGGGSICFGV